LLLLSFLWNLDSHREADKRERGRLREERLHCSQQKSNAEEQAKEPDDGSGQDRLEKFQDDRPQNLWNLSHVFAPFFSENFGLLSCKRKPSKDIISNFENFLLLLSFAIIVHNEDSSDEAVAQNFVRTLRQFVCGLVRNNFGLV